MTVPDVAPYDGHSKPVPKRAAKLAGARRGYRRAPLFSRQPAYKPGSGWHANEFACVTAIPLGRRSLGASSNLPGRRDPDTIPKPHFRASLAPSLFGLAPGGVCPAAGVAADAVRSYRTISPLLRLTTVPRRYVFCGTVPRFAPAGCYPAPFVRGARTFLSGNLSVSPERPPDRLTQQGWGHRACSSSIWRE